MKEKLFLNFWVTCGLMLLVAFFDLLVPERFIEWPGFVIAFFYFLFGIVITNKDK